MKINRRTGAALAVVCVLTGACGMNAADPHPAASPDEDGVTQQKGAIVVTGRALDDGAGNVLAALAGKVPNMRVRHTASQCPEIALRSQVNFRGLVSPYVYVDGTRATDTCVLETLRASDVERVEIYPQGFTTRPGYATNAHGLILVFMRSGA
jgi:hypothetical protein